MPSVVSFENLLLSPFFQSSSIFLKRPRGSFFYLVNIAIGTSIKSYDFFLACLDKNGKKVRRGVLEYLGHLSYLKLPFLFAKQLQKLPMSDVGPCQLAKFKKSREVGDTGNSQRLQNLQKDSSRYVQPSCIVNKTIDSSQELKTSSQIPQRTL